MYLWNMFISALDASGSEETAIFVVAGFVAPESSFDDLSDEWKSRLAWDGLDYFHMRQYAHSVGPWESWKGDEKKRRALLGDLLSIIAGNVSQKVGSVIAISRLERIPEDLRRHFGFGKYSLAGRTVAADIRRWARRERIITPIPMIFEDGDKGTGELMKVFENDHLPPPVFRNKKDRLTKAGMVPGYLPLQAADILAYEIFNAAEKVERNALRNMRWALGPLNKILGEPGIYLDHNIQELIDGLHMTQKLNEWGEDKKLFRVNH